LISEQESRGHQVFTVGSAIIDLTEPGPRATPLPIVGSSRQQSAGRDRLVDLEWSGDRCFRTFQGTGVQSQIGFTRLVLAV